MKNKVVEDSVQRQLLSLAQMDKDELAAKWQELFGKKIPRNTDRCLCVAD